MRKEPTQQANFETASKFLQQIEFRPGQVKVQMQGQKVGAKVLPSGIASFATRNMRLASCRLSASRLRLLTRSIPNPIATYNQRPL